MAGIYIFGGLFVVGMAALIYFKVKLSREDNIQHRGMQKKVAEEIIEETARVKSREK